MKVLAPKLKLVLFVHGIEVWNEAEGRKRRLFEPMLLSFVTRIASVSRYTAAIMRREFHVSERSFFDFPNAVDVEQFLMRVEVQPRQSVLVVSRLGPEERRKNIDCVIRSFAKALMKNPNSVLEVVGEGDLRGEYSSLARDLGIEQSIKFLGRLSDRELSSAYERARVFVLPSSKEGFGIVYLEAWCFTVPVICSSAGAASEIVDDQVNGWVVPPRDEEVLTAAIIEALENPQRALTYGQAGFKKVERVYSSTGFQDRLASLIMEVGGSGARRLPR